jgi:hypothetical protein
MNQGETEPELAMDLTAEFRAAETHLPLVRLFVAATLIGLGQATSVVLDSVAGPQDALHEFLYGAIDVLAKAALLLLALDTATTGFTLVIARAGCVRSLSAEVSRKRHTRPRWFS